MIEDPSPSSLSSGSHLLSVKLDSVDYLDSLPAERFSKLHISEVYNISETKEVFKRCSSLNSLRISNGDMLKDLYEGLEHLTALESLELRHFRYLILKDESSGMPWRSLENLRSLVIKDMLELEFLPGGMQYLATIQDLRIKNCPKFQALPQWISCLSSLESLTIVKCPALKSLPKDIRNLKLLRCLEIVDCSDFVPQFSIKIFRFVRLTEQADGF